MPDFSLKMQQIQFLAGAPPGGPDPAGELPIYHSWILGKGRERRKGEGNGRVRGRR